MENGMWRSFFLAAGLTAMSSAVFGGAEKGNCISKAEAISMSRPKTEANAKATPFTVKLEWDEDREAYTTNNVYYFAATLSRGKEYTVWLENKSDAEFELDADPKPATGEEMEPGAAFTEVAGDWGSKLVLFKDEWYIDDEDPEMSDPSSWTYIFRVESPNPGATATLRYAEGIWLPIGIEENPLVIVPKETPADGTRTAEYEFVTNTYKFCCVGDLLAGRRYQFATEGAAADNVYTLGFDEGKVTSNDLWRTDYNASVYFDPVQDGQANVWVLESATNRPGATFKLRHRLIPARPLKEHPLARTAPLEAGARIDDCRPGHVNATDNEYYDTIIDECLYAFKVTQKKRYVLDTVGAKTGLLMRIYDDKGVRIQENAEDGTGTGNVRCAFTAGKTGTYYVGLAENLADDDRDEPTRNPVTLRFDEVTGIDGVPDAWDAADDTFEGAALLNPQLGPDPLKDDSDGSEGWHRLGRTDWCDTFVLAVRKGITYRLKAKLADGAVPYTSLRSSVYYKSGKSSVTVSKFGDLDPAGTNCLEFTATRDAMYYVEVSNAGGAGTDYPDYRIHCSGFDLIEGTEGLGILKVVLNGTDAGTWSLNSEAVKYRGGLSVILPVRMYTAKFGAVNGFTTPPAETGVLVSDQKTTLLDDVWYCDKYDPKDDTPAGATSWSLANKVKTETRTLWSDDIADNFSLAGKDGQYYDIWLSDMKAVGTDVPDAVFSISNAELGVLAENVTKVHQLPLLTTKAKYILTVSHSNAKHQNTSYAINGFFANVGAIKFSAVEYKVKDNAAEVKLTVNRTAKDGKVRVKLWTEDGTNGVGTVIAKGVNRGKKVPDDGSQDDLYKFYHNQQTLEWANGDNKAKTVIIRLIPDKYPTFHDFVRSFTVKMEDAFDGSADCYHASFAIDSKTGKPLSETQVTFQESAKKNPGTVQVDDKAQDVKKPVFDDVRAGETLSFNLIRVDGDDGCITVKVDVAALTGVKNDFKQVVWEDGARVSQKVSIDVPPATDAKSSKKVTLKLSATSKDKPKFAASSITVNVSNDKFAATLADYAKALPKTCGYTIKEGKSGTWIVNDNGDFVSTNTPSALTFTITGPAAFSCLLHDEDGATCYHLYVEAGKTQTFVVPAGVKEVTDVKYEFNFGNYETVFQAVQYGYGKPIVADGADVKAKVSAGKLPDGIKLEQDKETKAWYVRGVPTKAGYFFAEIQDAQKNVLGTNAFEVVALRSAVGTFNGLATNIVAAATTNNLQSLAQVQMTATAAGKLSAKVAVGGKSYSLAATGFEQVTTNADDVLELTARLTKVEKKTAKVNGQSQSRTYTNELVLVVRDFDEADTNGWRSCADVALTMACLPDLKGSGFQEDVAYSGRASRDNSKLAAWVTEASQYAGYYTIALAPADAPFDGAPKGNGYLTLTLDAKGKVKIAGALANGTAYSASSVVGNLCTVECDCAVSVPLYSFKSPTLFGGWLTLRFKEAYDIGSAVAVLDKNDGIRWISQDPAATWDGTGFELGLVPVGGYYDTVASLQRYYLNDAFSIASVTGNDFDLLDDVLRQNYGDSYGFVARTDNNGASVNGMSVDLVGDTVSVAKQVLVKEMDGTKKTSFNDWDLSTNAANVKVTFKRATGILTGTCDFWYEGTNGTKRVQGAVKSCKHAGVLIMTPDASASSVLADDVWTAGSVVIPQSWKEGNVSRKWNASFPFNIKAEEFKEK